MAMIFRIISTTYMPVKTTSDIATALPHELSSNSTSFVSIARKTQLARINRRINWSKYGPFTKLMVAARIGLPLPRMNNE